MRLALTERSKDLPSGLQQSITWDPGTEMPRPSEVTAMRDVPVYFCDARSPWHWGSNENMNGVSRDYFPKGTDLSTATQASGGRRKRIQSPTAPGSPRPPLRNTVRCSVSFSATPGVGTMTRTRPERTARFSELLTFRPDLSQYKEVAKRPRAVSGRSSRPPNALQRVSMTIPSHRHIATDPIRILTPLGYRPNERGTISPQVRYHPVPSAILNRRTRDPGCMSIPVHFIHPTLHGVNGSPY